MGVMCTQDLPSPKSPSCLPDLVCAQCSLYRTDPYASRPLPGPQVCLTGLAESDVGHVSCVSVAFFGSDLCPTAKGL